MSTTTNQAQAVLTAIGNPEGWAASSDLNGYIECPRTLEASGRSATLAAMVRLQEGDEQYPQDIQSHLALRIEVVDDQLAKHIGVTAGLLSFTNESGLTFIDDTPENMVILA